MNQTTPVMSHFPIALDTRARIAAAHLRISRAELVRRATADYLKRLAGDNGKSRPAAEGVRDGH